MSDSSPPTGSAPPAAEPLYREKMWPAPWIWVVVLGFSGAGIFIFAPISISAGITAAIVLLVIVSALLILSTPTIVVTEQTVQVGRAVIERRFVGTVESFTGSEATEQRGTKLHGLAYVCIRGWISPVVRIEITDESDPTPYWLASTRRPRQLAAVVSGRRTGTSTPES
ncbi:DUF3093 domain-containing protein [Arthrobacter castelli]|uniref:DUF3093 domain-containing protein n=1 Tax=Arthrobacter castelli TaxID=271431 RepID=UPI00047C48C4|nr:DUF3093 domain-containing protein [Arthrobacter castelli]